MADGLPINFPLPSESSIASYDYTDLIDGEGKVRYNLYLSRDDSGTEYILGKDTPYSADIDIGDSDTAFEYNFDTGEFTSKRIIGGTATVNMAVYVSAGATTGTLTFRAIHYDGSSETEIGTWTSDNLASGAGVVIHDIVAKIPLSTKTFKRGDLFRLEIVWASLINKIVEFGVDPQNRDGDYLTPTARPESDFTASYIEIPFRIER